MAATTTVMHLLEQGAHVVAVNDVYGGTYRLFSKVYEPKGYRFTYVTAEECNAGLGAKLDGAAMLWLETPTNPLLNVVDLRAASDAAHAAGAIVVVDNTFASPYLQRPLEHGADIVVHSTTKYLGGHSDLVGGVAATSDAGIAERLRFLQNSLGAVPGPFDAWLALRGLKTLAVRMRAHCANAEQVVEFLQGHPAVERVLYPGLPDHPGHDIAARQMDGFGGMVSFLAGVRGRGGGARRAHADLDAGREPGRRREPHRAPRPDDPRLDRRLAVRRAGDARPALGRDRGRRRPDRRSRPGAALAATGSAQCCSYAAMSSASSCSSRSTSATTARRLAPKRAATMRIAPTAMTAAPAMRSR